MTAVGKRWAATLSAWHSGWLLSWRASRADVLTCLALTVVSAAVPAAAVLAAKYLVDQVAAGGALVNPRNLLMAAVVLGVLAALQQAARVIQANKLTVSARRVGYAAYRGFLTKTAAVDLAVFDDPDWHDRHGRIASAVGQRPEQLARHLVEIFAAALSFLAIGGVLLILDPRLLALAVLAELPILVLNRKTTRRLHDYQVEASLTDRTKRYLGQLISDPRAALELRAFGMSRHLLHRLDQAESDMQRQLLPILRSATRGSIAYAAWVALILSGSYALVAFKAVDAGGMSAGSVAAVITALTLASAQASTFVGAIRNLDEQAALFLTEYNQFLASVPLDRRPTSPVALPEEFGEGIRFRDVTFTYPGADRPALDKVSFDVQPGQLLAIVGDNGAGKSTLVKLLLGAYTPTSGTITLAGQDIAQLDPDQVRSRLGVLFQDFISFEFSLADNVRLGRVTGEHLSDDPMAATNALHRARASHLLHDLPDGLDTVVGRSLGAGHDLSGGQWQRVALARLFYRNADVWILDEPTSALDPEAEAAIFGEIRDALDRRIGIIISHRFSTVRAATRVIVLKQGQIIEAGTHDELLAARGRYAALYELQARAFR
jgi:ATP-binding cassette, subfamily B, bacterial